MKKVFLAPLCLVALAILAVTAVPAMAEVKPPIVGVVDVQEVVQKSAVAKNIKSQLDEKLKSYQKEVAAQEEKLRSAEKELMKQRAVLKPEELAEKRRDLQSKVITVQRDVETRKRTLDIGFAKAMATVTEKIRSIVASIAKDRGLTLVLSQQQVVFSGSDMDLTDEVLKRLNSELSSVKVDFTAPKAATSK